MKNIMKKNQKKLLIFNICLKLKELNVIDGIGLEGHLQVRIIEPEKYEEIFEKYANTGLEIQITELEIRNENTEN